MTMTKDEVRAIVTERIGELAPSGVQEVHGADRWDEHADGRFLVIRGANAVGVIDLAKSPGVSEGDRAFRYFHDVNSAPFGDIDAIIGMPI